MRIGINCLRIDRSYVGGLNTFTLGLLNGFTTAGNGHRFILYVTQSNQPLFAKFEKWPNFEIVVTKDWSLTVRKRLCQAGLLSRSRGFYRIASNLAHQGIQAKMDSDSDIIYTPSVVLQSFHMRRPSVLSMHDIQHVHYPEFFSWEKRLSRKITYGLSARYASYLQASSEFIKADMLAHFPDVRPERVEIISEGVTVEEFAERRDTSRLCSRFDLPERFLFYPAQLWPHKNHLTVLKALKQIEIHQGIKIPLVMTGAQFSAAPTIARFISDQAMNYTRYLGKVPFEDLVALYQKAEFLIAAGLYEASCLPVLEAAAAGTPIIAARIPPNEELGQKLQLNLFNPLDVRELAKLILSLWDDPATMSAQAAHNRGNVSFYSWANAARKYMSFFERIVTA
jgi:glycosyltransferase involved in cell wall biosynthesis